MAPTTVSGPSARAAALALTYSEQVPRRLLLAVIGGLCIWLGFPATSLWWSPIIGVACWAIALKGVSVRGGLLIGFVGGLAYFLPVLHWTGIYVGNFPWLALGVTETIYVVVMAGFIALVQSGRVAPWARRVPAWIAPRTPRVRPVAGALLWVTQEWVRGNYPFGGFPWVRLAWSQAGSPLSHLASIAGGPGLTFVVALLGGLLAVGVERLLHGGVRRPLTYAPLAGALAILAASVPYPVPTAGTPYDVVGIQGNVPTSGLEFNAQRRAVLDNHVRATFKAAAMVRSGEIPKPQLVVWPENSSDIDPTREADAATQIERALAQIDTPLIVGAVLDEPSPEVSNASLLYLPGQGLTDRYVKQKPVPFAEYIPYRSFFRMFSDKVDLVRADFTHGTKTGLFTIPGAAGQKSTKVGPVICFEIAYDGVTRAPVDKGAQLLIVQTNNATFGRTAESEQQLAISRIRAIEHGRSVVHVSTVGVSAMITPDGVVHDKTSLFTQAVMSQRLPLRSELTLADRLGALPEYVAVGVACLLIAVHLRRRALRRRRTHSPDVSATKESDDRTRTPVD